MLANLWQNNKRKYMKPHPTDLFPGSGKNLCTKNLLQSEKLRNRFVTNPFISLLLDRLDPIINSAPILSKKIFIRRETQRGAKRSEMKYWETKEANINYNDTMVVHLNKTTCVISNPIPTKHFLTQLVQHKLSLWDLSPLISG
jgi:hypothetical protein